MESTWDNDNVHSNSSRTCIGAVNVSMDTCPNLLSEPQQLSLNRLHRLTTHMHPRFALRSCASIRTSRGHVAMVSLTWRPVPVMKDGSLLAPLVTCACDMVGVIC